MIDEVKIYGAYGSNMNLSQMSRRCPKAKVIGNGTAKNYRLTFRGSCNGVANIEIAQRRSVPIVLWEITPECEKALDTYEGYPRLYVKKDIEVITEDGPVKAMVYVMSKDYESIPAKPSQYYFDIIWHGYTDNKISKKTLREALSENLREVSKLQPTKMLFRKFQLLLSSWRAIPVKGN